MKYGLMIGNGSSVYVASSVPASTRALLVAPSWKCAVPSW